MSVPAAARVVSADWASRTACLYGDPLSVLSHRLYGSRVVADSADKSLL